MKSVSIVYCKPCGYLKRATDAAAALEKLPGVTATLVPGRGGIFEVRVGGQAPRRAAVEDYTHVRWRLRAPLAPGATALLRFRATLG